jgi:hypothetical protein
MTANGVSYKLVESWKEDFMKLLLSYCIMLVICFDVSGAASLKTSSASIVAYQSKDSSILKPADVAYAEAMEFARFLSGRGIVVKSVHGSKLNGFFQGLKKAAFFRTDKGVVEVVFFPEPKGAEMVRVKEQRRAGRYLYSFEGQPHPNPPGDTIDAGRPMYFLMHRNWFIVSGSEELYGALGRALAVESSSNR